MIAYQPLASGALTGKYTDGTRPAGLRPFMKRFRGAGRDAVAPVVGLLREIGERHATGPAQVALRWLIQHGDVVPIPGAKNGQQAAANAAALSFDLGQDEIEELNRVTMAWRT